MKIRGSFSAGLTLLGALAFFGAGCLDSGSDNSCDVAGEQRCDGNEIQLCSAGEFNNTWETSTDCALSGQTCLGTAGSAPYCGGYADADTDADTDGDSDSDTDTDSDTDSDSDPISGPSFLMGRSGDATLGTAAALVRVTPSGTEPIVETLTEIVPPYLGGHLHAYRNGRMAFIASAELRPVDRGPFAVFDVDSPGTVYWSPIPVSADPEWAYSIPEKRPQILSDGRIVFQVNHYTIYEYDDAVRPQLAVWDPATDALVLQGDLAPFYLSQPEVIECNAAAVPCDMESGHLSGAFAVSPDDRYVYYHINGFGVDMMMGHTGYSYFARWDLLSGTNERLWFLNSGADVWTVTGDNVWVVIQHEGLWKKWDIAGAALTEFDSYPDYVESGQTSAAGPNFIKSWRQCEGGYGGIIYYDLTAGTGIRMMDANLYADSHKGIDARSQVSPDGQTLYFAASSDACTNYAAEFVVMSTPLIENNPNPTTLMTLSAEYSNGLFILL